jgi:integrase
LQVRVQAPDGARVSLGTFESRRAAFDALAAARTDQRRGTWTDPSGRIVTLDEVATRWFATPPGRPKRPRTIAGYRSIYATHLAPNFGPLAVVKISPKAILDLVDRLKTDGRSPSTIRHCVRFLGRLLNRAVQWGYLGTNPVDRLGEDIPSGTRTKSMLCLNVEEVGDLARAADRRRIAHDDRMAAIPGRRPAVPTFDPGLYVLTAAYCGAMRAGEIAALQVGDFDPDHGTLRIERTLSGTRYDKPKTAAGNRLVHVPEPVLSRLIVHAAGRAATAPLFTSPTGAAVDHHNFYERWFKPAVVDAGLCRSLRFHDLRHTGISLALAAGVPLTDVAAWAGHASPSVTMAVYAHAVPGRERVVTAALEGMLGGARTSGTVAGPSA